MSDHTPPPWHAETAPCGTRVGLMGAGCHPIFPTTDWHKYDVVAMSDQIEVTLICTRAELVALQDAMDKAKGGA